MLKSNDLVLISNLSPILCGIYTDGRLVHSFEISKKTLDALVEVFALIRKYNVRRVFYANGPGSFTAIKLTHIFLQTLQIVEGIELFCTDAFYFNASSPIKAFGNQYFLKINNNIILESIQDAPLPCFALPSELCERSFSSDCKPLYVLPAVS